MRSSTLLRLCPGVLLFALFFCQLHPALAAETAAGNGSTGTYDGRIPMRHGGRQPFSAPGTYKGNFAFWDGHVETMNDVDMSKPDYWMPTGSNYTVSSVWPVTVQRFNIPSTPAMAVAQ